jgi:putative tricarboxylic transport membrane protein
MTTFGYSTVIFIIAFFLGPRFETSLSQSLVLTGGNPAALLKHPVAVLLFAFAVAAIWWLGYRRRNVRPVAQDAS